MRKIFALILLKKIVLVIVLFALLLQQQSGYSQVFPATMAANFVVNRAVAGAITKTAVSRGFASTDPRLVATLNGASNSLTTVNIASSVAGVGLAIAGAPVWLTLLAGLGIFAVGAAIVAGNSTLSLEDGKLKISSPGGTVAPSYSVPVSSAEDKYTPFTGLGLQVYRASSCVPSQYCYVYPPLPAGRIPFKWNPNIGDNALGQAYVAFFSLQELINTFPIYKHKAGEIWTQAWPDFTETRVWNWIVPPKFEYSSNGSAKLVGKYRSQRTCVSGACTPFTLDYDWDSTSASIDIDTQEGTRTFNDLNEAATSISPETKAQPIEPEVIARIADEAWKHAAAQPGYDGLPYSVTRPVTGMDVREWQAEHPIDVPKLIDLFTPANNLGQNVVPISTAVVPNTGTTTIPNSDPITDPNAIRNVNIINVPKVDLGADPKIPTPTLEATPSAGEILVPLLTLFPELKNYQTPQHVGMCPKPEFSIFEKSIVMDSHCKIAEEYRQAIAAIMLTVWLLVGLFILLSA